MADSTKWCVAFVHGVGSPRVKVLYDIYHAGMMKEDIVEDVTEHADRWGHFHTGGVPGRHEIDDTQTLDYRKIMEGDRGHLCAGHRGLVGQEITPRRPQDGTEEPGAGGPRFATREHVGFDRLVRRRHPQLDRPLGFFGNRNFSVCVLPPAATRSAS